MSSEGRMPSVDTRKRQMDIAPYVFGAAVSAACDSKGAELVTEVVIVGAARHPRGRLPERRRLVEEALLLASDLCPKPELASMEPSDREAVVLARLGRYTVAEIAVALGITTAEAKRRLRRGLEAVASSASPLPSGSGPDLRPGPD
jgi:DNA-directed RNA polymerase specialized sigma24 family protein